MIFSEAPNDYLMHYGIKGQKWGIRRYQNPDGTLTAEGRERYKEVFKNSFSYQNSNPSFVKVHNNLISKYKINNPNASKEDIQNLRKSLNKLDNEYIKENLDKFALANEITTFKGTTKLGISATSLAVARLAKIYSDLNGDSTESKLVEGAGYVSSLLFGSAGLGELLAAGSNNKYFRSLKTERDLNGFKKHSGVDDDGKKLDSYEKDVNGVKVSFVSRNNDETKRSLRNLDKINNNLDEINDNCRSYLKENLNKSGLVDDNFQIAKKPTKIELDNGDNKIGLGYKIKTPNESFTYIMGYDLDTNKPSYSRN